MFTNPKKISVEVPSSALTELAPLIYAERIEDNLWLFHTKDSLNKNESEFSKTNIYELINIDSSIKSLFYLKVGDTAIRLNERHDWKSSFDIQNNQSNNVITGHEEWQENQYNPGHFTGGKIPEWMKNPGSNKAMGWLYLIVGIVALCVLPLILFDKWKIENWEGNIMMLILTPLCLAVGVKYLFKK